jgi:DNA-binding NtrC family response regulator
VSNHLDILLVEDHADTCEAIAKLLRHRGHVVVTAADCESAIREAKKIRFDLLIADIGLPDGDGLNILPELQKLYPIRGITVSGYRRLAEIVKSADAGYSLYLSKPFAADAIIEAVEQPEHAK